MNAWFNLIFVLTWTLKCHVSPTQWQLKHFIYPGFLLLSNFLLHIDWAQLSLKLVLSELWNRIVTFNVEWLSVLQLKMFRQWKRDSFKTYPIWKCNLNYIRMFSVHQTFSVFFCVFLNKANSIWLLVYLNLCWEVNNDKVAHYTLDSFIFTVGVFFLVTLNNSVSDVMWYDMIKWWICHFLFFHCNSRILLKLLNKALLWRWIFFSSYFRFPNPHQISIEYFFLRVTNTFDE